MATSGEMAKKVAEALTIPHATAVSYLTVLRQSGLITTGGRGKSAPQVKPLDIARLVIALMGADALSEGAAITDLIGSAAMYYTVPPSEDGEIHELIFENSFSEILSAKAAQLAGEEPEFHDLLGNLRHRDISVTINSTQLIATIKVKNDVTEFQYPSLDMVTSPDDWKDMEVAERLCARALIAGLITRRSIDGLIVEKLAKILLN